MAIYSLYLHKVFLLFLLPTVSSLTILHSSYTKLSLLISTTSYALLLIQCRAVTTGGEGQGGLKPPQYFS